MTNTSRWSTRAILLAGAVLVALAATAAVTVPAAAADDPPPPIVSIPLTPRSVFPDDVDLKFRLKNGDSTTVVNADDPSNTVIVKYTVQPNAQFPWHSHLGPVVVNIVSGSLTYIDGDTCTERTYTSGQAFVDPGQGHVHSARNAGSVATEFLATFYGAPAAPASLLIPAAPVTC